MSSAELALFLHGGPGLSAAVERRWFGDSLPVHWWDQPLMARETPAAFGQLVAAARKQLEHMARASGGPVRLLASSFGGQLATALARDVPQLVRDITLLGCRFEPVRAITQAGERLLEEENSPELRQALYRVEQLLDVSGVETLLLAIAGHPAFPAIYFSAAATQARDRFLQILPQVRFFDPPTFVAVMREFLTLPPWPRLADYAGPVTLVLGQADPVLDLDADTQGWQSVFPRLRQQIVEAGHFVHLELSAEQWRSVTSAGHTITV